MTAREHRAALLNTVELHRLNQACKLIHAAFGTYPYLVGSAGIANDGEGYRDVDVRLVLSDDEFAAVCPTRERWEVLCLAFSVYLSAHSGLPVDFQIQQASIANERFPANRNPLGTNRAFAGGGDGTPDWRPA